MRPQPSERGTEPERCFACGRALGRSMPALVDTRDGQTAYVGRDCARLVRRAGEAGYQPPLGGPRLYQITDTPTPAPPRRDY